VSTYRLYLLDNDRIVRFETVEADYDAEAVRIADEMRGDRPAELWQLRRRVAKLTEPPRRSARAPASPRPRER
jgi:hypothetical protein